MDRKYALSKNQIAQAMEMYDSGRWYWGGIALHFGVSIQTLRRYVRGAELYGYSFWTPHPRED